VCVALTARPCEVLFSQTIPCSFSRQAGLSDRSVSGSESHWRLPSFVIKNLKKYNYTLYNIFT